MALLYEVERFTKLSGEDGKHTSIERIGAFLDGYATALGDIDAEPVIHCKDCEYYSLKNEQHTCYLGNGIGSENAFCSYAERRTDESVES